MVGGGKLSEREKTLRRLEEAVARIRTIPESLVPDRLLDRAVYAAEDVYALAEKPVVRDVVERGSRVRVAAHCLGGDSDRVLRWDEPHLGESGTVTGFLDNGVVVDFDRDDIPDGYPMRHDELRVIS